MKNKAAKLADFSRRYDFHTWAAAACDKFKDKQTDTYDWTKMGLDCGALFTSAPPMTVMLGPISKPVIVRKIAGKKGPREIHVEIQPEELIQTAEEDDEATNERIQTQSNLIMKLCYPEFKAKKKNDKPAQASKSFDLLQTLVDPQDPVQTVENLFDFAFMIKEKQVGQKLNEDGIPVAQLMPDTLREEDRHQMVLTMGMKDLKKLSKLVASKSVADGQSGSCPLHRNDLLYSAKNAHEQVIHIYVYTLIRVSMKMYA